MSYLKQIELTTRDLSGRIYITDEAAVARRLKQEGEAVVVYFHDGNRNADFSDFLFGLEDPEEVEEEYLEKVYRRLKGLPWNILETDRCLIRETTPEDVEAFYQIYHDPAITEYMEDLYPEKAAEEAYIREYIEKIYTYYEFGVWTIVEKQSNVVIGRAGFSFRAGYEDPEIGFIIGVPWQRKGFAFEVCKAILDYGRHILHFGTIQALVETGNEASLRLCDKLGFGIVSEVNLEGKRYFLLKITPLSRTQF